LIVGCADSSVERMIKCREKAGLKGRKIQVTGALALNVYTATVGTEQRTVKKLYVKVHAFELLGGLKSEEEETEEGAPPGDRGRGGLRRTGGSGVNDGW
jgi:hypothetical protein